MEDVFQMIDCVTRSKEQKRAFFKPNFETAQPVMQVNKVNYSKATKCNMLDWSYNGQSNQVWFSNNFRVTNRHPRGSLKKGQGQQHYKHSPRKLTCYYCEGEHMVKDCIKLAKEKSRDKQKDTDMAKLYKNKTQDSVQRGNITINEASLTRAPEIPYSLGQTEQLLGNLQLDDSDWLDRYPCQVTIDKVCHDHIIKYKITVNSMPVNMLYDTGALMICMAKWFFDTLPVKAKLIPCNRYILGMRGEKLRPIGKYFIHLQIEKKVFRDRVVVIKNLRHKYILGQVLHRMYWFGTGYSTTGKHYITINGQVIAQSILQTLDYPIIKTRGKITLLPMSVSIIEVKTPKYSNTTNLYEVNADTFQLPEGIILLDILHRGQPQDPTVPEHLHPKC